MGWRRSGPPGKSFSIPDVTKVISPLNPKPEKLITPREAMVFGILVASGVAVAAGSSVRKAYNEKSLKPHLTY